MAISFLVILALLIIDSPTDAALIGSNNPTFENDYFASDNMAWVRPNKFVNYGELIRTNNYDGLDHLEEKRRYRPGSMKRRYRPGSLKRRYLPSSLNDDDMMMKRAVYGLWKPAQLVGKVNN